MVARVLPVDGIVVTFQREEREIERMVASTPARAAQMAVVLIGRMGELHPGDLLTVTET